MENNNITALLYTAKNESDLLIKTSILESENIYFILKNYNSQDLFGIGKMGASFNLAVGNPEIWVSQDDYEHALALIDTKNVQIDNTDSQEDFDESQQNFFNHQFMKLFIKIILLFGIIILLLFLNYIRSKIAGYFFQ
jgi:hypothetical protein